MAMKKKQKQQQQIGLIMRTLSGSTFATTPPSPLLLLHPVFAIRLVARKKGKKLKKQTENTLSIEQHNAKESRRYNIFQLAAVEHCNGIFLLLMPLLLLLLLRAALK